MYTSFKNKTIAVLGAGSWGIALAKYCDSIGHRVRLWEFDASEAARMASTRRRNGALPGVLIPDSITITPDLTKALTSSQIVLLVVPSHVARSVLQQIKETGLRKFHLVSCIKGIENNTLMRMSQLVENVLTDYSMKQFAVLSGPSHAEEVSQNIPTAVVIAAQKSKTAEKIQKSLTSSSFRMYRSQDIVGVELGGALKNVIAIAAGICDGAGFGDNTKAALQPRGLAEIARLGKKMGADPLTFMGLSGMGDLIVTCMSQHSRNRYVGEQVGKGLSLDTILENMTMVAEGVRTCQSARDLAKAQGVEMPICRQVYEVLFNQKSAKSAVEALMTREVKPEVW